MIEYRLQITLKAARVNAGFTQEEVEHSLGVSKRTLIRWENGETQPKRGMFLALCCLYGVRPEDIKKN